MTTVRMRRVLHDELGTAIGFLTPYNPELLARLKAAGVHGRFSADEKAWFVAEADAPVVLELVEQFLGHPAWDDMILRDYEGVGVPPDTEYEQVRATAEDYALLGVDRGASVDECRRAYREKTALRYDGALPPADWERIREAFERIARYD